MQKTFHKNVRKALAHIRRGEAKKLLVILENTLASCLLLDLCSGFRSMVTCEFGVVGSAAQLDAYLRERAGPVIEIPARGPGGDEGDAMLGRLEDTTEAGRKHGFCGVVLSTTSAQMAGDILTLLCLGKGMHLDVLASPSARVGSLAVIRPLYEVSTKALLYHCFLRRDALFAPAKLLDEEKCPERAPGHRPLRGERTLASVTRGFVRSLMKRSPASISNVVRTQEKLLQEQAGETGPPH